MKLKVDNIAIILLLFLLLPLFLIGKGANHITGNVIQDISSENITIGVTIINSAPVFGVLDDINANASEFVNGSQTATDADADPLIYNYTSPLNENGTWQTHYDDWGIYNITTNVSDGRGGNDTANYSLIVHGFPLNITYNEGNITLNWTAVDSADYYLIYYSNDYDNLVQQVTSYTNTEWNDTSASSASLRYYRVGAYKWDKVLKSEIVLKYDIPLAKDWNLISSPINLSSYDLGLYSATDNIVPVRPKNILKRLHRYNVSSDAFEMTEHYDDIGWIPATGSEHFTELEIGRGYWFETNDTCTLTLIGRIPRPVNLSVSLDADYNIVGWYSLESRNIGKDTIYGNTIPLTPANSVQIIYRYRTEYSQFEGLFHFAGWGWWPFGGSVSFTKMEPGRGYYFLNTQSSTWEHEP